MFPLTIFSFLMDVSLYTDRGHFSSYVLSQFFNFSYTNAPGCMLPINCREPLKEDGQMELTD